MKSAEVFRIGPNEIGVCVRENDKRIDGTTVDSQSAAIDWLYNYHFDVQSLKIDTRSYRQIEIDEAYEAEMRREWDREDKRRARKLEQELESLNRVY